MKETIIMIAVIIALAFTPALACKGDKGKGSESSGKSSSDTGRGQDSGKTSGASANADRSRAGEESNGNGPTNYPCDILIFGPDCDAFDDYENRE